MTLFSRSRVPIYRSRSIGIMIGPLRKIIHYFVHTRCALNIWIYNVIVLSNTAWVISYHSYGNRSVSTNHFWPVLCKNSPLQVYFTQKSVQYSFMHNLNKHNLTFLWPQMTSNGFKWPHMTIDTKKVPLIPNISKWLLVSDS